MKFELWQKVFDKKKEITGIIIKITNGNLHVEYKRFKGDEEPFYISYPLDTEELSIVKKDNESNSKYIISKDFLTIGKLKKVLNKSSFSDNTPVVVEMVSPDINWEQKVVINKGTADESTIIQAWSANNSKNNSDNEDCLIIWLHY
jgi:hypothetical protein